MLQSSSPRTSHPLDLPLPRRPGEVSLSAFALLFSELVQLHQTSASSVSDFESLLSKSGWEVGSRTYLMSSQVQGGKNREIRVLGVLQFLSSTIWTSLFNKKADSLEKSLNSPSEYMIHDSNPLPSIFCEVPPSLSSFNPNSFVSGIVKGALETAGFGCEVTAHGVEEGGGRTVFLVDFCREVMEREEAYV
mmetsp:Transcript_19708/g.36660  ORF Transcript_19708/g.36660 Transcript_19708/m.36660 type:complete len:191 (-) Transcript_19708:50-622(-)